MSSRLFEVRLHNETTLVLHRHSHSVKHGTWRSWLPERVGIGSDAGFLCSFTRTFNGVYFNLVYGVILNRVRYLLQIQLERNGQEESLSAFFVPESQLENATKGRTVSIDNTCPVIFKVHQELVEYDRSDRSKKSYRVRVQETTDGSLYIKGLKDCMDQLLIARATVSSRSAVLGGLDAFRSYESLPDDFTWTNSRSTWLNKLRKSNRSVLIRIMNFTGKQLKLLLGPGNTFLEEGQWVEYPADEIPHLCGTEFGVRSSGYFAGTGGQCVYTIMGESGNLKFSWEQPSMGSITASGTQTKGKYSIAKHVESINEATLVFHIYDLNAPPIDLWAAKAIHSAASPKALDLATLPRDARGYHIFDRIAKSIISSTNNGENVNGDIVDVLPLLISYYAHGSDAKSTEKVSSGRESSSLSETEFSTSTGGKIGQEMFLKNPRHFFRSVIMGKRRDLDKKVTDNHLLYLEWGIGNERFSKIFAPDERVYLRGNIPGGLENKKVLFHSHMMSFRFDRPEVTHYTFDSRTLSHSVLENRTRPFLRHITQDDLLEYVLMIFHALCEGLQPYVTKPMAQKYGPQWLDKVSIPVGHVWKSDDHVRIDIEGMIYLITAYWLELFEEMFEGDSNTLHTIQTAAIYWANQELYRFDSAYVWDMLEATERLLYRLKADSAIKNIEFISQKLVVP